MKNKITCLLAGVALFGATANADIVLADGLTAYGYIDMSALDTDEAGANGDRTANLSQYEFGLSFTPAESQWSAVAELSYSSDAINDPVTDGTNFETVAVTYQYSDALSFSFGNLYTFQGLESDDAPDNNFITYAGEGNNDLYAADYAEGIAAVYSAGDVTLAGWAEGRADSSFQYYASYRGIENLTLAVAIIDYDTTTNLGDSTNIMATYEIGDFTISAENVDTENIGGASILDVTSVAVAYSMGDTTIAVRSVDGDYNQGAGVVDYEKTSIAAFHALGDNVAVGVEYSDEEFNNNTINAVAVELLYVF